MTKLRVHRDQAITSHIMSAVKGRGSKAEIALARSMWNLGLRYRKHPKHVMGKPDFIFAKLKIAVFCDGDFWHGKGWGKRGFKSWEEQFEGLHNRDFWRDKIARNMARDEYVSKELQRAGWIVLRFLESEILREPNSYAEIIKDIVKQKRALLDTETK
jgi:DNA mismatch endonuclease (patch repair protein)